MGLTYINLPKRLYAKPQAIWFFMVMGRYLQWMMVRVYYGPCSALPSTIGA